MIISKVTSCPLPEQGECQNSKLMMTWNEELETWIAENNKNIEGGTGSKRE
jgi:hypothetical protein